MKRPINVDFSLDLRIIGESKSCLHICSDEGDGYDFIWKDITRQSAEQKHYKEWAEQLHYVVEWLKLKAGVV